MKQEFASTALRCPNCRHDRTLRLAPIESDEREVRTGVLSCTYCGVQRPVKRGVADLLVDPPDFVQREDAGLGRFARLMQADGWTPDRIRQLPDIPDGYWYVQTASMRQLWDEIPFRPGQTLLDLGSNTCWASNYFASRGLAVTALDISLWEMQGLWTADYFIGEGISYFERVRGSMTDVPVASESMDYVFACQVLHHNDPQGLYRAFEEAYRVLKPGGRMLIINETLKTVRDPIGVHDEDVMEFEGYEHAHWAFQYRYKAARAGFSTRLLEPVYHEFFPGAEGGVRPRLRDWRRRLEYELRHRPLGRKALLAWVNHVAGGASFGMVATKPHLRPLGWRPPRRIPAATA